MVKAWFDMIVARPAISNSQLEMKIEGCCATFASCPRNAWTVWRRNKKNGRVYKDYTKNLGLSWQNRYFCILLIYI